MGKQLVDTQPNSKPPVVVSREEMMRQWQMAGEKPSAAGASDGTHTAGVGQNLWLSGQCGRQ